MSSADTWLRFDHFKSRGSQVAPVSHLTQVSRERAPTGNTEGQGQVPFVRCHVEPAPCTGRTAGHAAGRSKLIALLPLNVHGTVSQGGA